jgi:hypothetical protein
MKKLVGLALGAGMVLAVGCGGSSDGGLPTARFLWDSGGCPDLSPAGDGREAAVIIDADDSEFGGLESFAFDCGDGDSLVLDIEEGTWDFFAEAVDLYASAPGTGVPENCFGDTVNENCLYYTSGEDSELGVDTLVEPDFNVDFDLLYAFGAFDVQYSLDQVVDNPEAVDCDDFDPDVNGPATDMSIVATFYEGSGLVEDVFVCGGGGNVISRDLPLGDYALAFDLLNSDGDAILDNPVTPDPLDCPAGVCTLTTHLQDLQLDIDFDDPST